jgi:hypothetical protein
VISRVNVELVPDVSEGVGVTHDIRIYTHSCRRSSGERERYENIVDERVKTEVMGYVRDNLLWGGERISFW